MSKRLDQIESSHQDYHPIGISIDEKAPHASQTVQVLLLGTSHGIPFHISNHSALPPAAIVSPPIVPIIDDIRLVE